MQLWEFSGDSPEVDLALDEALLEEAERGGRPRETLRLWETRRFVVVVGRSSRISVEVRQRECAEMGIPILRRTSGGAAIVAGPGCLMFSLVLSYELRPELRGLDLLHSLVMDRLGLAVSSLVEGVSRQGTCDLTWNARKFSGNAVRCRRQHVLYHGTMLYDFPLELMGTCLGTPPRQPDYRGNRSHADFVTNLPVTSAGLRAALAGAWQADGADRALPRELVEQFVAEKYAQQSWNYRLM